MGNNNNKQERIVPESGYRVVSITKQNVSSQLNLLTDYIISPDPKLIDLKREFIRLEVYSILSQEIRSVQLPVVNRQLGLQVRLDSINTCIFRITKIFPSSPLQKYNILSGQFIVGCLEGNFSCLKTFAQLITNITIMAPKSNISLGICGQEGKTRIVVIPVIELKTWQARRKGLLGCQLAEGWIHKWKPQKQKKEKMEEQQIESESTRLGSPPKIVIPTIKNEEVNQGHSDSSNEIDEKCDKLQNNLVEGAIQIKFKGVLKSEEIADASTICKCKPLNKNCQKCFIHKDENYYFFCAKSNQIVAISSKMLMQNE